MWEGEYQVKFAVIGAGHGGQAMAGYLSLKGFETVLYNRSATVIRDIIDNGGIDISGCICGKATSVICTSSLVEAVNFADIIMVCIPSHFHDDLAKQLKELLRKNQIIVLNPGRTLGAYFFSKRIDEKSKYVKVAETDTFILTSRKVKNGRSTIFSLKKSVFLGCMNRNDADIIAESLRIAFPMLKSASSIIYTSMSNIGTIFHPLPAILNIGRIENREVYLHYKEGITPAVCHMLEKLDAERVELAQAMNVTVYSAKEWIHSVYESEGESLYEVIQNTEAYDKVYAPMEISTRYIYEDISTGIVPMFCLAKKLGCKKKMLELIIRLATEMLDYDFLLEGRNDIEGFLLEAKENEEV